MPYGPTAYDDFLDISALCNIDMYSSLIVKHLQTTEHCTHFHDSCMFMHIICVYACICTLLHIVHIVAHCIIPFYTTTVEPQTRATRSNLR